MAENVTADDVGVSARAIPDFDEVAPWAAQRLRSTDASRDALAEREAMLTGEEGKLAASREAGLAGPRADLAAAAGAPLPSQPRMEPTPEPPSGPIIDPEKFKDFGKIAFPFVLLLGKAMRADGTQALNALSHSVQGYMQGREQESKVQFEQYKAKFAKVVSDNKQKLEEYRELLQRRDLDMQQKMQLLEISAQKYDDAAMYYSTQRKSIGDIYKHLDKEDQATMKVAAESVKIEQIYMKAQEDRARTQALERNAQARILKMGSTKGDATTLKKLQWLQGQQINLYKTFAEKMSALTQKQMPESSRKLAEQQLRNWFAGAMYQTNQIGRAEGFQVPPELAAFESPQTDPLGPVSTPASEAENKSWFEGMVNAWHHMFGGPPGANASQPQPPAGQHPGGGGGVVDFNQLPP